MTRTACSTPGGNKPCCCTRVTSPLLQLPASASACSLRIQGRLSFVCLIKHIKKQQHPNNLSSLQIKIAVLMSRRNVYSIETGSNSSAIRALIGNTRYRVNLAIVSCLKGYFFKILAIRIRRRNFPTCWILLKPDSRLGLI